MIKASDNAEDGPAEGPEGDVPMSFFDHLSELRQRLVRSALSVGLAFGICYALVDRLTIILTRPFKQAWDALELEGRAELQNLGALDAFLTDVRIAAFASVFLAGPMLFYQLWMFISPGLYKREKKLVVPFVSASAIMFLAGAMFCYYLVLPVTTEFFLEYPLKKVGDEGVAIVAKYTYTDYTTYTTKLLLGFGLMFEFPLAVFFLARAGLITHKSLMRHYKGMIVAFFVIAAFLTPPEPISQVLMATPMVILYFASVGIAYFASKPEQERLARLEAELAAEAEAEERAEAEAELAAQAEAQARAQRAADAEAIIEAAAAEMAPPERSEPEIPAKIDDPKPPRA